MNPTSTTPAAETRLDMRRILPIFAIVFVDLMGLTIIIPLLPLYAASFGADAFMIGALQASYPLMQFIGAPILGTLSDRFGRKPVLLASQVGSFAGFLLLGFAGSLPLIFLARMIDGTSGGNLSTAQAALSDSTNEHTRAQGLGLVSAAFGLGFIFGPVITAVSLTLSQDNYRLPAFIAAGFSLASILLTAFIFPETLPPEKRETPTISPLQSLAKVPGRMLAALKRPSIGYLLLLLLLLQGVFSSLSALLSPLLLTRVGLGAAGNAVVSALLGVLIVILQGGLLGPLSRRFGERRLILGGQTFLAVGMLIIAFLPMQPLPGYSRADLLRELHSRDADAAVGEGGVRVELPLEPPPADAGVGYLGVIWLALALIPISIGNGLILPNVNSLLTKSVSPFEVGRILGVSASFYSAANTLGPLYGGSFYSLAGATALFLTNGVVLLLLLNVSRGRVKGAPPAAGKQR
jgi:MFS family permease